MEISSIEKIIIDYFRKQEGVIALLLFGSFAKGTATAQSDVDVAVLYRHENLPSQWDLIDMQETLSGQIALNVHVVCLNRANPIIGMHIYRTGKLLLNNQKQKLDIYYMWLFEEYIELKEL